MEGCWRRIPLVPAGPGRQDALRTAAGPGWTVRVEIGAGEVPLVLMRGEADGLRVEAVRVAGGVQVVIAQALAPVVPPERD